MSDSNRFKLDPNIVKMVGKTKGINYGHAIAKAFTDIGGIAEQQKENELKQIETDTKRLQYESVADTLADDKKFAELLTSDDPKAYMQKNPFKTSKYVTLTNDFIDTNKNKLSKEQQDKHFAMASSMFTKEDGSFDIGGAKGFLKKQYESGKIDADTFHNVVDTIGQKTKTGVYAERVSEKDKLGLLKTQTEIQKNLYDLNNPKEYAPTTEEKIYNRINSDPSFKKWYEEYSLNKKMGTGVRDMKYANEFVTNALNTDDKALKSEAANMYSNIYKDAKEVDKFFRNLAPTVYQLNEAQKLVSNGGAGVSDEIKNQFSVWTGLNWDDTTQEGRTAFLSTLQPLAKTAMTGTVSDRDMKTLENSFASLWQSDKAVANALKNKTQQILFNANQYANKHPNYIKLTGYENNIKMLESIINSEENKTTDNDNSQVTIIRKKDNSITKTESQLTTNTVNSVEEFDKLLGL
jgi:hypothetical protein